MGSKQEDFVITWARDRATHLRKREEKDLFPFSSQRKGQREFLAHARSILQGGGHLVAHAPTGIGKTAAALTAALEAGFSEGKVVFFLTSRHSQHKIAMETLEEIYKKTPLLAVDIVGKEHMCSRKDRPERPAFVHFCSEQVKAGKCPFYTRYAKETYSEAFEKPLHVEELFASALRNGMCPHRVASDLMEFADIVVCDYNYFFGSLLETVLSRINRPLCDVILVVDEAHNLPDRIRSEHTLSLNPYVVGEAFKECRGTPRIQHYLMLLQDVFNDFSKEGEGELDKMVLMDLMGAVLKASISPLTYDEFSSELRKMGEKKASRGEPSASVDVADFLDLWAQDLPSAVRIYRGGARPSISYRLLDPSHMASPIFEGVHSSLLMSGTLYPMKMYRDLLGLETRRTILKEYLSPFPKSNRPIFMDKGITTKFSERGGEMYDMLASNLGKYISRVPGNVAVFFQSYGMLQEVGGRLDTGTKDRWTESSEATKEEKDLLLGRLLRAKKGEGMVVLGVMGASMAEGIDYKDNALEMVVVVGIPLAPPNLETKLLTEFYTNLFGEDEGVYYGEIQPAMNKVLQAAGRAIRSAEDRAVVILMDNRFGWHRYKKCFPHDFNITPTLDVEQAIEDFFSA